MECIVYTREESRGLGFVHRPKVDPERPVPNPPKNRRSAGTQASRQGLRPVPTPKRDRPAIQLETREGSATHGNPVANHLEIHLQTPGHTALENLVRKSPSSRFVRVR